MSRRLRWCFTFVPGAIVVLLAAAAIWITVTQRARSLRETHRVQQLAADRGRWVRGDDAELSGRLR